MENTYTGLGVLVKVDIPDCNILIQKSLNNHIRYVNTNELLKTHYELYWTVYERGAISSIYTFDIQHGIRSVRYVDNKSYQLFKTR